MSLDQICDFIIYEETKGRKPLNQMKLQKLLFYTDAWYTAFKNTSLFIEGFQAWIHGPVSRSIYDRFHTKDLYSVVTREDMTESFNPKKIPKAIITHVKEVLNVYSKFSGSELEMMSQKEEPWVKARTGYGPTQLCQVELDKGLTGKYFAARLK